MNVARSSQLFFFDTPQFDAQVFKDACESFDRLPVDQYIKSEFKFRRRRYGSGHFQSGIFTWNTLKPFVQSSKYNHYLGDVVRHYAYLETKVQSFVVSHILPRLMDILGKNFGARDQCSWQVGVHQYRIEATSEKEGHPAPEGIHQDGHRFQAILGCGWVENIRGAVTELRLEHAAGPVVFCKQINHGDMLVFDDERLFHFTTPFISKDNDRVFRDVIIVTLDTS